MKASDLFTEAQRLSEVERLKLADDILDSIAPVSSDVTKQWAQEGRARLEAYERGQIIARPLNQVMQELQDDLRK